MGMAIFKIFSSGAIPSDIISEIMFYGVAVKLNFRPYILRDISPNENFEYSYPLNLHPVLINFVANTWFNFRFTYAANVAAIFNRL